MTADKLPVLPVSDEWPHAPGSDDFWQESVVLTFQDVSQRIGGFIRIGHNPNRKTANFVFGIVTPNLCYNRSGQNLALQAADRFETGFSVDSFITATFDQGTNRWTAEDKDCSINLTVQNLHPLFDAWKLMGVHGEFQKDFAPSHTEVAGLVKGNVRIGKEEWFIDGFGFRDHSWGVRRIASPNARIANFFWLIGSFGSDLIFAMSDVMLAAGKRLQMGFVIVDGKIEKPTVKDASFRIDLDGISLRGADLQLETPSLGAVDFSFEGFGNVLLDLGHEYLESGTPGLVRLGDRVGGAHISSMFNARGGTDIPKTLLGATLENGIYRPAGYRGKMGR